MNIEDEWKNENNDEPIIIESEDMEDDDWVEDIDEKDEDKNPVTIEQMKDAIDESKKIMLFFIKDNFGEDIDIRAEELLNTLNIDIDSDEKTAEACSAYHSPEKGIFLTEKYCKKHKDSIDMLHTIIHEYAHAFSSKLSKGYVNAVIEEAFADLFGEICINYYIQNNNRIKYISEKENDDLLKNGFYDYNSYINEGDFVSPIMYALKKEGRDIEALKEYFGGNKEDFLDICEVTLGWDCRSLLEYDLFDVHNQLGVENNTKDFLPQAIVKIRNVFMDYLNGTLDEKEFKFETEKPLYSSDKPLLNAIAFESKLRQKLLSNIASRSNADINSENIFSNLTIADIQQITLEDSELLKELCSRYGFSDFIKKFIKGWYLAPKDNPEDFEKIMPLIGGYIPFDICTGIIQQQKLKNTNDIFKLLSRYNVLSDEDNYLNIIEYINTKINNRISKTQLSEDYNNKDESMIFLNQNLLEGMSDINLSDEQLRKIMYLYSNPISRINNDNIIDVIDVLNNIDYSELPKNVTEKLASIGFDLATCICYKEQNKDIDLGVLISAHKLPNGIGDELYNFLIFENKDEIFNKSKEAIQFLKEFGLQMTNEQEVLDLIESEKYKEIQFKPELNANSLYAFMADTNKTKILLNAYINQFFETTEPDFFNNQENINVLLMLLDVSNQNLLGMSDITKKRICSIIENKVNTSETILDENRTLLNRELRKNYRAQEGTQKLSEFFEGIKARETMVVSEHIMDYLLTSGASSYQVDSIINFYNTKISNEIEGDKNTKYDLKNINSILNLVKNCNIDISSDEYNFGADQLVIELMTRARTVEVDDSNIKTLQEIYGKLQNIKGLDEEIIREHLFDDEDIMNRICTDSALLDSAIQATIEKTREGVIRNQSIKIIDRVEQEKDCEERKNNEPSK